MCNACSPCEAFSLHQWYRVLSAIPRSRATCVMLLPLVCARRTASSLNSFVNVRCSFGIVPLPFCGVVYSNFLSSTKPGPAQGFFRKQFGLSSSQIGERSKHNGGCRWFDPTRKTFLDPVKADTYSLLDRGKHRKHELNLS